MKNLLFRKTVICIVVNGSFSAFAGTSQTREEKKIEYGRTIARLQDLSALSIKFSNENLAQQSGLGNLQDQQTRRVLMDPTTLPGDAQNDRRFWAAQNNLQAHLEAITTDNMTQFKATRRDLELAYEGAAKDGIFCQKN